MKQKDVLFSQMYTCYMVNEHIRNAKLQKCNRVLVLKIVKLPKLYHQIKKQRKTLMCAA